MPIALRPLTPADIPAWAALLAACERVDQTGENYDEDDLAEELADPTRDPARDFFGAWRGDDLVGYAAVRPRDQADGEHRIHLEGATHPDHRGTGVGTASLEWAVGRAGEAHAGMFPDVPAALVCDGLVANGAQTALLQAAGFTAQRWNFGMECRLDAEPPPADVPSGLAMLPYDAVSAEAARSAHNDAFLDHWGFAGWSPAMWQQWVTDTRAFRPGISRVLVADGASDVVVGYVISYEYEADAAATGIRTAYVGKVGVRRAWRRKGAASALLSDVLRACRAEGYGAASLDVDADNPTGALGVYRRMGFEVAHRWVTHGITIE
ncbi:MAG: GNAT family N-acetyltransferase [Propionibacteriales bacterium]|nr:GNAT family N-acetyltransferase [Propionibacteriales bacterium]